MIQSWGVGYMAFQQFGTSMTVTTTALIFNPMLYNKHDMSTLSPKDHSFQVGK